MTDKKAPFFVGYQPMPAALARFYRPLALALIIASGVGGYWVGAQQSASAPAHWDTAAITTAKGVLTLRPYPTLHRLRADNPGEIESLLLVRQGKHSADDWARAHAGKAVAVSGHAITRGRWTMLEIATRDAIAPAADVDAARINALLAVEPLGAVEVNGEIADSKCFLGVMKPGAGVVHKACAEICLRGGIPPLLVAEDARGQQFGYLLALADGGAAATQLVPFAAESVQVRGQLQRQGGLLLIRVDDGGVRRM